MNTSHTPGPWHVAGKEQVQIRSEKHQIAKAWSFAGKTGQANARLIAAAPDLLAALQGLDEAYCRAGTPLTREERTEDRKRIIAARAAIAKATK